MNSNSFAGWYSGQRVICVDGSFPGGVWEWADEVPVASQVYTIRVIFWSRNRITGLHCHSFLLAEILNPTWGKGSEISFAHFRFRPLEEAEVSEERMTAIQPCGVCS